MKRKLSIKDLKKIIRESLMNEELEFSKKPGDSLDSQVDKYLIEYEKEAKELKNEYKFFSKKYLLKEENEDKENEEKLDVESFATNLVRLINNYDSLLEIKNTLIKRAINFLGQSYDVSVVNELKNTLREVHGLVIDQSEFDKSEEKFPAPPAERAGASGTGGT